MIITDPTERPSARFLQVVKPFFESQGYQFNKTKKQFQRPFSRGTHIIGFWFRIGVLTSVDLNWRIQFEKLEKVHATLLGRPRHYKSLFTLGTDLSNYTKGKEMPYPLYDEISLYYDDFSINAASEKTIEAYKNYAEKYLEQFLEYGDIYKFYEKQDWRQTREILLSKYFSASNFEDKVETFRQEVYKRHDRTEIECFEKTIQFLNDQNIRGWLD